MVLQISSLVQCTNEGLQIVIKLQLQLQFSLHQTV